MQPAQGVVSFEEVAVSLSREEWALLSPAQRDLCGEVMLENFGNVYSLGGPLIVERDLSWLEEEEGLAGRSGRSPQMSPLCAEGKSAAMQPAQAKVSFEEVAVDIPWEEWALLSSAQRVLYCEVMRENYRNVVSLGGPLIVEPDRSRVEEEGLLLGSDKKHGLADALQGTSHAAPSLEQGSVNLRRRPALDGALDGLTSKKKKEEGLPLKHGSFFQYVYEAMKEIKEIEDFIQNVEKALQAKRRKRQLYIEKRRSVLRAAYQELVSLYENYSNDVIGPVVKGG